MEIQWHISPTSQYGKLYYPWYVMDYHNPWIIYGMTEGFEYCSQGIVYHIVQYNGALNPISSALSKRNVQIGGKITYCKVGETWETRGWKGVANFETTPFELWRTRTGLPKKIHGRERLFCEECILCSSAPDCQLFLAANGSCVSNCSPLRSS